MITILIADDHKLVRETWSVILQSDPRFTVVAECGTGEEAVELSMKLRPQLVIMDINMPGMDGIDATSKIRKFAPGSKIIGISLHTQPAYARKMFQRGALGYITKSSPKEEMFNGIMQVMSGNKYVCKEIRDNLSECDKEDQDPAILLNKLSHREMEIIALLKEGLSSKEIATNKNLAVKTVEVHRYNILKKLNLNNTAALINFINNSKVEI